MTSPSASATIQLAVSSGVLVVPKKAVVEGSLNTEGYGDLVRLPSHLTVNGDLSLRGTSIKHLPAKLHVLGNVDIEGCKSLRSIKKGCVVEGNLDLEGCSFLSHVADDLYVGGDLFLRGTDLSRLPKNVVVKGQIYDLVENPPDDEITDMKPLRPRQRALLHRRVEP